MSLASVAATALGMVAVSAASAFSSKAVLKREAELREYRQKYGTLPVTETEEPNGDGPPGADDDEPRPTPQDNSITPSILEILDLYHMPMDVQSFIDPVAYAKAVAANLQGGTQSLVYACRAPPLPSQKKPCVTPISEEDLGLAFKRAVMKGASGVEFVYASLVDLIVSVVVKDDTALSLLRTRLIESRDLVSGDVLRGSSQCASRAACTWLTAIALNLHTSSFVRFALPVITPDTNPSASGKTMMDVAYEALCAFGPRVMDVDLALRDMLRHAIEQCVSTKNTCENRQSAARFSKPSATTVAAYPKSGCVKYHPSIEISKDAVFTTNKLNLMNQPPIRYSAFAVLVKQTKKSASTYEAYVVDAFTSAIRVFGIKDDASIGMLKFEKDGKPGVLADGCEYCFLENFTVYMSYEPDTWAAFERSPEDPVKFEGKHFEQKNNKGDVRQAFLRHLRSGEGNVRTASASWMVISDKDLQSTLEKSKEKLDWRGVYIVVPKTSADTMVVSGKLRNKDEIYFQFSQYCFRFLQPDSASYKLHEKIAPSKEREEVQTQAMLISAAADAVNKLLIKCKACGFDKGPTPGVYTPNVPPLHPPPAPVAGSSTEPAVTVLDLLKDPEGAPPRSAPRWKEINDAYSELDKASPQIKTVMDACGLCTDRKLPEHSLENALDKCQTELSKLETAVKDVAKLLAYARVLGLQGHLAHVYETAALKGVWNDMKSKGKVKLSDEAKREIDETVDTCDRITPTWKTAPTDLKAEDALIQTGAKDVCTVLGLSGLIIALYIADKYGKDQDEVYAEYTDLQKMTQNFEDFETAFLQSATKIKAMVA